MMKICIVAGARPNFFKIAPLLRAAKETDVEMSLVYTGKDDDPTLEHGLFEELAIKHPDAYLGVDSNNLNEITAQVMFRFDQYLHTHPTDTVIVVDDLASTMAVAIVTKKQGITLAHLSAGTRSFNIKMPKEVNRIVIDGLSDILFTAGMSNNSIANREGAALSKVYMVGNLLTDNIRADRLRYVRPAWLDELAVEDGNYLVLTLNRRVLLEDKETLSALIHRLAATAARTPIIAPLQPEAMAVLKQLPAMPNLHLVAPLGYLTFGYLAEHAKGIITDSDNVAEEATFRNVPCITLNTYAEHIETVTVGSNLLVGTDAEALAQAVTQLLGGNWKAAHIPDRWDGRSAERILQILTAPHNTPAATN